jgi:hypothetical protein
LFIPIISHIFQIIPPNLEFILHLYLRFNPFKNPSAERNGEIMKKFIAVGSILVILFIALTRVSFAEGRNSPGLINEMRVHQKNVYASSFRKIYSRIDQRLGN